MTRGSTALLGIDAQAFSGQVEMQPVEGFECVPEICLGAAPLLPEQ